MVNGWDQGEHLSKAIDRAGMNGEKLLMEAREKHPEEYDVRIEANQEAPKTQNLAGHTGVSLFVLNDECFLVKIASISLLGVWNSMGDQAISMT